jgi:hypothetical protein
MRKLLFSTCLAWLACLSTMVLVPRTAMAHEAVCSAGCVCDRCRSDGWHTTESDNFRVMWRGHRDDIAEVCQNCESLRGSLYRTWLDVEPTTRWTPKCDVVLCSDDATYLREVGPGGRNTVASALVSNPGKKVAVRRIDVRRGNQKWIEGPFAHELTHVVIADRLELEHLPRWADEGMATLADSTQAFQRGGVFRLAQLLTATTYPAQDQWGAFYGQSVSLVNFLVERDSPARFVEFLEAARVQGYAAALRSIYQIDDVAALERQWRKSVLQPDRRSVARLAE